MESEIRFQALDQGVGITEPSAHLDSRYNDPKEDQLLSTYSKDVFFNLDLSGDNYDRLIDRLEKPILDSLENQDEIYSDPSKQSLKISSISSTKSQETLQVSKEKSLSKKSTSPPLGVLAWDYGFSLGTFLIGYPLLADLFQWSLSPIGLALSFVTYGFLHQLYVVVCRSSIGCTFGEERYNLGWDGASSLRFIARGFISVVTGFLLIPMFSILLKRDLFGRYTGLKLRYNI